MESTIEICLLDFIMRIVSDEKFVNAVKSYEGFKICKISIFSTEKCWFMGFQTVFPNFRVLRETFLRFCWHISEGFGVKKNDAVVHFGLSITVQKSKKCILKIKRDLTWFRLPWYTIIFILVEDYLPTAVFLSMSLQRLIASIWLSFWDLKL